MCESNHTHVIIFSVLIKVNPWKKPEPAAAPVVIQTAEPAVPAPERSPPKPAAKKAEKNPPSSSSSSAMAKKDAAMAMEGEGASAATETAEKKQEVRRLPPAPKTNPWKKPVPLVKEKEETDQPKVCTEHLIKM
jgi:hypothetical protein